MFARFADQNEEGEPPDEGNSDSADIDDVYVPVERQSPSRAFSQVTTGELVRRSKGGDQPALTELLGRHVPQIRSMARTLLILFEPRLELNDLQQEGWLGVLEALTKFDPSQNVPFSAYAKYWISKRMIRSICTHGQIVRETEYVVKQISALNHAEEKLQKQLSREPADAELAAELGWSLKVLQNVQEQQRTIQVMCFSELSSTEMDSDLEQETQETREAASKTPEYLAERNELLKCAAIVLNNSSILKPRSRLIFVLRLGLNGDQPLGYREIGDQIGISEEGVRRNFQHSCEVLRRHFAQFH